MDLHLQLLKYCRKENNPVSHPSKNTSLHLKHFEITIRLLVLLLEKTINEPTLTRVKQKFEEAFEVLIKMDYDTLPSSVELLAANFESFLKKIAFLKYNGDHPELWNGDKAYKGISDSTMYEILESSLSPKENTESAASKQYPTDLVEKRGFKKAIYNELRLIRNSVHYAKDYDRISVIKSANTVIAGYLFAVEDNLVCLRKLLLPECELLALQLSDPEISRASRHIIELTGTERINIETNITETYRYQNILQSIESLQFGEEQENESDEEIKPKTDSLINIVRQYQSFVLLGNPGSGKSTSLRNLFSKLASDCLNSPTEQDFPVLIEANHYNKSRPFSILIQNAIAPCSLENLSENYKLIIIIDGINEISEEYRITAHKELTQLLKENSDKIFLFSSRKYGFKQTWRLPIYELNEPTESQIQVYIENVLGEASGIALWNQLISNNQLLQLSFNPLYLAMIIHIFRLQNKSLPYNKGILYQTFCEIILERESKVYRTPKETKIDILAHLAYTMRQRGHYRVVSKIVARDLIADKLRFLNCEVSVDQALTEILDNGFLFDKGDDLHFLHETYEEYFIAVELRRLFVLNGSLPIAVDQQSWLEALEMSSNIFLQESERQKFFNYLFIGEKSPINKELLFLTSEDIGSGFRTACRLSYNIRTQHPEIFKTTVAYLRNYLAVWLLQTSRKINSLDFRTLLEAVALLSERSLFTIVFTQLDFVYHWIYSESFDKGKVHTLETFKICNPTFEENLNAFIRQLSDFPEFYRFLTSVNFDEFWFSKSLAFGLEIIRRTVTATQEARALIRAFEITRDERLLRIIGRLDIDYFIVNSPDRKPRFYRFVARMIKTSFAARTFLFSELKRSEVNVSVKMAIIETLLLDPEMTLDILAELDSFDPLEQERLLLSITIRKLLYFVPYETLQAYSFCKLFRQSTLNDSNDSVQVKDLNVKDSILEHTGEIKSILLKTGINLELHPDIQLPHELPSDSTHCVEFSTAELQIIKKLELAYLFETLVPHKSIGYITNVHVRDNYTEYLILMLNRQKVVFVRDYFSKTLLERDLRNRFCICHPNGRVRLLKFNTLKEKYYKTSYIIRIDYGKQEGFVKNIGNSNDLRSKDYYFRTDNCNFTPIVGMKVQFLPGINFSRNYSDAPFAYDVGVI